jgi:tRNA A-37 threonylcarbamoyl transferase component Bud32
LPEQFVLKKPKPDGYKEYDIERESYQKLKSIQGTVTPVFYGEAVFDEGVKALVLSDVGGVRLDDQEALEIEETKMKEMVKTAYSHLTDLGFAHDDINLGNFHLVHGKIFILDICIYTPENAEEILELDVKSIMRLWKDYRDNKRRIE